MLSYRRPLVPIAISYICGIIFARYFYIPLWLCIIVFVVGLFIKKTPYKGIIFYLSIFVIGYLFYQFSLQYNFLPRCYFIKDNIRRIIAYNMPYSEEKSLIEGLLLGERQTIPRGLKDILQNTNTIHILAISGVHIGFIGVMFIGMLRLMFIPRKISALIALISVLFYVAMVGWEPPTFRAGVMFSVFAIGWIVDRPIDTINTLALAAVIILLVTPQALFQAGFQLSFIIVLSLLLAIPNIKGNYLMKTFGGSFVAWMGSLPLVAHYFKIISPVSVIANLVMVPGISIVIALGFTSIFLGNIYLGFSGIFNATNYWLVKSLIGFLRFLSQIPCSYFYIQDFPIYLVFISYLIIGIVFFFLLQKRTSVVE